MTTHPPPLEPVPGRFRTTILQHQWEEATSLLHDFSDQCFQPEGGPGSIGSIEFILDSLIDSKLMKRRDKNGPRGTFREFHPHLVRVSPAFADLILKLWDMGGRLHAYHGSAPHQACLNLILDPLLRDRALSEAWSQDTPTSHERPRTGPRF